MYMKFLSLEWLKITSVSLTFFRQQHSHWICKGWKIVKKLSWLNIILNFLDSNPLFIFDFIRKKKFIFHPLTFSHVINFLLPIRFCKASALLTNSIFTSIYDYGDDFSCWLNPSRKKEIPFLIYNKFHQARYSSRYSEKVNKRTLKFFSRYFYYFLILSKHWFKINDYNGTDRLS